MRRLNQLLVLDALREAPALTASDLMTRTGLSRASAHAVCDDLIHRGWVRELDPSAPNSPSGVGRPSRTYAFDAKAGLVFGIDLGVSTVTVRLCDLRGDVVVEADRTADTRERPVQDAISDALDLIDELAARSALDAPRIRALALGVPAPVDRHGRVLEPNPVIPGLDEVDLPAAFAAGHAGPVLVENDANLGVLGERWKGVAQGSEHVVMILAGERLGSGLVEGGRLLRGYLGEAGELDWLSLVEGVGNTHGAGRAAREMGAQAVSDYQRTARRDGSTPGARIAELAGAPDKVQAEHVLQAAREGDETGLAIMARVAERMARTVAAVSTLLNPEIVIIGGAIAAAGDTLLDPMRHRLLTLTKRPPRLAASTLGDRAVVTGAVRLALDHALAHLLT